MSNYTIKTGFWVNHDLEPAVGATLTVSIRWGNYLIAALSSLVAWAGSRAWSILYFYLHQRLARKRDKDVLHQQLQVHFRAGGSFFDSIVDGFDLNRAWSGRLERVKRRTLSLVVGAVLFFVAFAAGGVLVAEVASQSNQDVLVLAAPSDCGDFVLQDSPERHNEYLDSSAQYRADLATWARNYARDVYNGTKAARFDAFAQSRLPFSGAEVACPFTNGTTCLGVNATKDGGAWMMETGPLDSHNHFGINAPPGDRITWSKSVTCSVMDPTNLTTRVYSRVEHIRGEDVNKSYIGVLQQFAEDLGADSNLAFELSTAVVNERIGFHNQRAHFQMGQHNPAKDLTGPPFLRYDADVVLSLITQSRMFYYAPVDDPLFLAHEAVTGEEYAYDMEATVYYPSTRFGLLACSEQMQTCDPVSGVCTSPNGTVGWAEQVQRNEIGLNAAQLATALRIVNAVSAGQTFIGAFAARGGSGLLVAETRGVRAGQSIPPTQWQTEVNLWFAASLAALQSGLLGWVAKPWPQGKAEMVYPLTNTTAYSAEYDIRGIRAAKDGLCENQLIRSSEAMQNFSVLALVLVVFVCVLIIVLAAVLPCWVTGFRESTRRKKGGISAAAEAGELARIADGKFSLLAMTLANAGVGEWEKGKADIPVTKTKVVASSWGPLERKDSGLAAYPSVECLCKAKSVDTESVSSSSGCSKVEGDIDRVSEKKPKGVEGEDLPTPVKEDKKEARARSEQGEATAVRKSKSFERIQRCETDRTLVDIEKR